MDVLPLGTSAAGGLEELASVVCGLLLPIFFLPSLSFAGRGEVMVFVAPSPGCCGESADAAAASPPSRCSLISSSSSMRAWTGPADLLTRLSRLATDAGRVVSLVGGTGSDPGAACLLVSLCVGGCCVFFFESKGEFTLESPREREGGTWGASVPRGLGGEAGRELVNFFP